MKKKILIIIAVTLLLGLVTLGLYNMYGRNSFYEYIDSAVGEDSNGGVVNVDENFVFVFENQDEFESLVNSTTVEKMCSNTNELFMQGTWTFVGVESENSIIVKDKFDIEYLVEFTEEGVIARSK